jgi:hypothetical protein
VRAATSLRPSPSTKSISLVPITSRTALMVASRRVASGSRTLNKKCWASATRYWTATSTFTIFSSRVSISPLWVLVRMLSTLTFSTRSMG